MDDDDWLEDAGPSSKVQGGAGDPLVDNEWNKLATKYSDVSSWICAQVLGLIRCRPVTAKESPMASCRPCSKGSIKALMRLSRRHGVWADYVAEPMLC